MQAWEAYWAPSESSPLTVSARTVKAQKRELALKVRREEGQAIYKGGWEEYPITQQKPLQLEDPVKMYFKYWKTTNVNHEQNYLSKLEEK